MVGVFVAFIRVVYGRMIYMSLPENTVLEVLSKFSTSQNTANIYGSWAGSY